MADPLRGWGCSEPFLLFILLGTLWEAGAGHIRYSVPEELDKGSFVGNIAKDLGLEPRELEERGVRIVSRGRTQLFALNPRSGSLVTADRIDREELCAQSARCLVSFNILVENKMKMYGVEVEITDINDNFPRFRDEEVKVKVNENAAVGTPLVLPFARDADVGVNSLQRYQLSSNIHFSLDEKSGGDGQKYPELVLEQPLDREKVPVHDLLLTALDGGDPILSGTTHIHVMVLDANDNAPLFTQPEYRVSVPENIAVGTRLLTLTATDPDEGINGKLTYSFRNEEEKISETFQLDSNLGEISTVQPLDYEESRFYNMEVVAQDGGALLASAKVLITVQDVNDNAPEVLLTSLSSTVSEDCLPGTIIALFSVHDGDSGENGEIVCSIPRNLPFKLVVAVASVSCVFLAFVIALLTLRLRRWYTSRALQASGSGLAGLPASHFVGVDGVRAFLQTYSHEVSLTADSRGSHVIFPQPNYADTLISQESCEKSEPLLIPGTSIAQVNASDPDLGPNGQVSYSIMASDLEPRALSSYVSVNPQSGVVFAQRAFDHEQLRAFELTLQARDHGSPALSANVSLRVLVGDRNDNAPRVLYPALGPDGSALFDTVPRAAQPGYLVTKVVAVDADSGHNAWLSYHVLQASEPGLFSVGLRTGEVRTARALGDRDAARQRLLVAVRDGGQPPLSATATLLLVFADSLQEALPDLSDRPAPPDPQAELQFYLVVALALISVLFLLSVILAVALSLRRSSNPATWSCFQTSFCSKTGPGVLPNYGEGTLPYSYNLCAAAHSSKTEFKFLNIKPENAPPQDLLCNEAFCLESTSNDNAQVTSNSVNLQQQAPPNTDWRFSQAQRPGTSGSQNGDETGTWPNNQFDTEMLQAMILASASEAADGSSTLGGGTGTMGLSARYGPQFTLQHVPDYRQNVYIPGSNATLTNAAGKRDGKAPAGGNGNKKKSGKKEKK